MSAIIVTKEDGFLIDGKKESPYEFNLMQVFKKPVLWGLFKLLYKTDKGWFSRNACCKVDKNNVILWNSTIQAIVRLTIESVFLVDHTNTVVRKFNRGAKQYLEEGDQYLFEVTLMITHFDEYSTEIIERN